MGIVIHASGSIGWHSKAAEAFKTGLAHIGLDSRISSNQSRESDIAILLGTTLWRNIEASGRYLLVDRASIGDPEFVQLVWDGHGRRGNHCVPEKPGRRAKRIMADDELKPWQLGARVVLCGQTETYSPDYGAPIEWYSHVLEQVTVTHFRKHPAGDNPTRLPGIKTWKNCGLAITLNSSVAVDAVLNGIPTVTMDEAAMAWDVAGHWPNVRSIKPREPWLDWLAYTQWHYDEISDGKPIKHLFEAL